MELGSKIEYMEKKLDGVEVKTNSTYEMVKEIHGIVIGTEHNKNDSLLVKMMALQKQVDDLEMDKVIRDTKNKMYVFAAGFLGTAIGSILVTWLSTLLRK